MTPDEALHSVQDSIRSAESIYDREEVSLHFVGDGRTTDPVTGKAKPSPLGMCINIAIRNALPNIRLPDETRYAILRILFQRKNGHFNSSDDMTTVGASALRHRLYGDVAAVDKFTPMDNVARQAIREAYHIVTGVEVMEMSL